MPMPPDQKPTAKKATPKPPPKQPAKTSGAQRLNIARAKAPVHPQPGFFETTSVMVATLPDQAHSDEPVLYTHEHYLAQCDRTFADLAVLKERSYEHLLNSGWVPTVHGFLADPGLVGAVAKNEILLVTKDTVADIMEANPDLAHQASEMDSSE